MVNRCNTNKKTEVIYIKIFYTSKMYMLKIDMKFLYGWKSELDHATVMKRCNPP